MQTLFRLVVGELERIVRDLRHQTFMAGLFGSIAALGILPLLCFAIIGLGNILNGKYWLSSLIVAGVCIGMGSILAVLTIRRIQKEDLNFGKTVAGQALETEREALATQLAHAIHGVQSGMRTMSRIAEDGPGAAIVTGFFLGLVTSTAARRRERERNPPQPDRNSAA